MQRIYNEATFVVGWLGPDAVEISALLTLIKHVSDAITTHRSDSVTDDQTQEVVLEKDLMSKPVHVPDVDSDVTLKEVFGVSGNVHHTLFGNALFKRVWSL